MPHDTVLVVPVMNSGLCRDKVSWQVTTLPPPRINNQSMFTKAVSRQPRVSRRVTECSLATVHCAWCMALNSQNAANATATTPWQFTVVLLLLSVFFRCCNGMFYRVRSRHWNTIWEDGSRNSIAPRVDTYAVPRIQLVPGRNKPPFSVGNCFDLQLVICREVATALSPTVP